MNTPLPLSSNPLWLPQFMGSVHAGFPSPATDYAQRRVDLLSRLKINEEATYMFTVLGDSMIDDGIYNGNVLIIDRSVTPVHNAIVLAVIDNEYAVKQLYKRGKVIKLLSENKAYPPIELQEGQELQIWGVVKGNLRIY
jgi:DNA polymerase V